MGNHSAESPVMTPPSSKRDLSAEDDGRLGRRAQAASAITILRGQQPREWCHAAMRPSREYAGIQPVATTAGAVGAAAHGLRSMIWTRSHKFPASPLVESTAMS